MQISARNTLKGRITLLTVGEVDAEVTLKLADGIEIVSVITRSSVAHLGLAVGQEAYAVIKASSVMVAIDS